MEKLSKSQSNIIPSINKQEQAESKYLHLQRNAIRMVLKKRTLHSV